MLCHTYILDAVTSYPINIAFYECGAYQYFFGSLLPIKRKCNESNIVVKLIILQKISLPSILRCEETIEFSARFSEISVDCKFYHVPLVFGRGNLLV